jgi:hypothetical protein
VQRTYGSVGVVSAGPSSRHLYSLDREGDARIAGLTLRERRSGRIRESFTSESRKHSSDWEKPAA